EPAVVGPSKQLLLLHTTLYAIAQLGMAESLFYFVPREPERAGHHVANAVLMLTATGMLAGLVLLAGGPFIAGFLGNPAAPPFIPLVAAFLAGLMATAPFGVVLPARCGRTARRAA